MTILHPSQTDVDAQAQSDSEHDTQPPRDLGAFEVAALADDALQADLLAAACEDAGIPAIVQSRRSGAVDTISSPAPGFRIAVPQEHLARATQLLAERRAALDADPAGAERAAEQEEQAGELAGGAGTRRP